MSPAPIQDVDDRNPPENTIPPRKGVDKGTLLIFAIALLVVFYVMLRGGGPVNYQAGKHPLLDEALAQAQELNRPVLLKFHADWCGYCHQMENTVFAQAEVQAALNDFVVVEVDTDRHQEIAGLFGVSGLPTTVILAPDGQELERLNGTAGIPAFLNFLERGEKQVAAG